MTGTVEMNCVASCSFSAEQVSPLRTGRSSARKRVTLFTHTSGSGVAVDVAVGVKVGVAVGLGVAFFFLQLLPPPPFFPFLALHFAFLAAWAGEAPAGVLLLGTAASVRNTTSATD